jgi:RimJ/RimL family protein N-acetyltransferase
MFVEIGSSQFENCIDLFEPLADHMICGAVLRGQRKGRIFTDLRRDPTAGFVFSPDCWCYLCGDPQNPEFISSLHNTLQNWRTYERSATTQIFVAHPEAWLDQFSEIFPIRPVPYGRLHYTCTSLSFDWRAALPEGFKVLRVDQDLLYNTDIQLPEGLTGWIHEWASLDEFLEKGFGFITVYDHDVVSWCMADAVHEQACEIGIYTEARYRMRGLGAATTAAAVEFAFSRGLQKVGWHCADNNYPSIRTAERVGFELEDKYTSYWHLLDEKAHLQMTNSAVTYFQQTCESCLDKSDYRSAAQACQNLLNLQEKPSAEDYHLAARAFAGQDDPQRAMELLRKAAESGWNYPYQTSTTREFSSLKEVEGWTEILDQIASNKS